MKSSIRLAFASISTSTVLLSLPALAAPQVAYSSGINSSYSVSASDLLETGSGVVSSVSATGNFTEENTGGYGVLTDGLTGVDKSSRAGILTGSELTYNLTSHAGYYITAINIYSTWGDGGRVDANVNVSYSLTSAPGVFIPLTNVSSSTSGFPNPWTESSITNVGGGNLLTSVAALRFDFPNQQNGYVGYGEIDAIGSVVPEPSTTASLVLGLGVLALCLRRKLQA